MRKENEPLKKCGEGFINLANLVGGLSFVNVFLTQNFKIYQVIIVFYIVILLYGGGYNLIKREYKR